MCDFFNATLTLTRRCKKKHRSPNTFLWHIARNTTRSWSSRNCVFPTPPSVVKSTLTYPDVIFCQTSDLRPLQQRIDPSSGTHARSRRFAFSSPGLGRQKTESNHACFWCAYYQVSIRLWLAYFILPTVVALVTNHFPSCSDVPVCCSRSGV